MITGRLCPDSDSRSAPVSANVHFCRAPGCADGVENGTYFKFRAAVADIKKRHHLPFHCTREGDPPLLSAIANAGWTWGTSARIALVWVREDERRGGQGARLLAAAEQVARARGCKRINVSSFTFQAPGCYAKHGYREVGRTEALPLDGQADVHFVKHLG